MSTGWVLGAVTALLILAVLTELWQWVPVQSRGLAHHGQDAGVSVW